MTPSDGSYLFLGGVAACVFLAGFYLARKVESTIPLLEKCLSLSLLAGILASLVSLHYVAVLPPPSGLSALLLDYSGRYVRGWPIAWYYGYDDIGLLMSPIYFVAEFSLWILIAATVLTPIAIIKHYSQNIIWRHLYPGAVLLVVVSPLVAPPLHRIYILEPREIRLTQQHEIHLQENDVWVKDSLEEVRRSIRLENCSAHLSSAKTPGGAIDIVAGVTAIVTKEHEYWMDAYLRNDSDTKTLVLTHLIAQTLGVGEHPLQFTFPARDYPSRPPIDEPGPYRIWIEVTAVKIGERYLHPSVPALESIDTDTSKDGLEIGCQTEPYQLSDFGLQVTSPTPAPGQGGPARLAGTQWNLIGYGRPEALIRPESEATMDIGDRQISGYTGCNTYLFTYTADGHALTWAGPGALTTRRPCGTLQEDEFMRLMNLVTGYTLEADQLTLTGAGGVLVLERATPQPLEGTTWRLMGLIQDTVTVGTSAGRDITLTINEGQVSGFAGCNDYFGTYEINKTELTFGALSSTKKACERRISQHETNYLEALARVASFSIVRTRLTLLDDNGTVVMTLGASSR